MQTRQHRQSSIYTWFSYEDLHWLWGFTSGYKQTRWAGRYTSPTPTAMKYKDSCSVQSLVFSVFSNGSLQKQDIHWNHWKKSSTCNSRLCYPTWLIFTAVTGPKITVVSQPSDFCSPWWCIWSPTLQPFVEYQYLIYEYLWYTSFVLLDIYIYMIYTICIYLFCLIYWQYPWKNNQYSRYSRLTHGHLLFVPGAESTSVWKMIDIHSARACLCVPFIFLWMDLHSWFLKIVTTTMKCFCK